jgi:DNA repair protein RecO (recombination protein O)
MEWRDEGFLLTVRPHGESSAIIEVMTRAHGRHAGVVRGGASSRMAPALQPGVQLDLAWRARLQDHVGSFTVEQLRFRTAIMADRLGLAGLGAVCALLAFALPERDPHPALYAQSAALLDQMLAGNDWAAAYLRWELALLDETGYGLDLTSCAVTGSVEELAYVSPRSGRAVSRAAAGAWADRLLPLPEMLTGGPATPEGLVCGLHLSGHFLENALAPALGNRPLPEARRRLAALFQQHLAG